MFTCKVRLKSKHCALLADRKFCSIYGSARYQFSRHGGGAGLRISFVGGSRYTSRTASAGLTLQCLGRPHQIRGICLVGPILRLRCDCGLQYDARHRLAIVRSTCASKSSLLRNTKPWNATRYEHAYEDHANARSLQEQIRSEIASICAKVWFEVPR